MEEIFRPWKILLKTRDAIYPVIIVDSADFNRKGTAFATKFQSDTVTADSRSVMVRILAFTPSSEVGVSYYINTGRSTRLELEKHRNVDGLLIARADQQTESLVRKTLNLDDCQGINNAKHCQIQNISVKMYVVKSSGSTPKTYLLTKVENGGDYVKYKLRNDGKIDTREELPIGAPVVNCYPRRWRKSSKKLVGMVQSVEDDGIRTILSVLHFDVATRNQILNGNTGQQTRDSIDALDSVGRPDSSMAPTPAEDLINNLHGPTRQKICKKLNLESCIGGDYKTLAGLIGMPNDDIRLLQRMDNPADEVLIWWERRPDSATITNLREKLLHPDMAREDVVYILDNRPPTSGPVVATETCDETPARQDTGF